MKFTRGYKESRERLRTNAKFLRSCYNCAFYYQAVGDKEEVCQNPSVLEYDMVVTETNVYCLNWVPATSNDKTLFKKTGRARLE